MNERSLARAAVVTTVASVVGMLFWLWAELDWKNVGGRPGVIAVTLGGAAASGFWAFRLARRPIPIDWIFELVRTGMLATFVSGVGALVAHLGDLHPGSPVPTNDYPNVSTPAFAITMLVLTVVGTSSVVPVWWHRHAVGRSSPGLLSETLFACGTWVGGAVALVALAFRIGRFAFAWPLVALAVASLGLLFLGTFSPPGDAPRRSGSARAAGAVAATLALVVLFSGLFGVPLETMARHRDETLCRENGAEGLLREPEVTRIMGYRAPGLELRRIDCRTTAQSLDERRVVVVGRDASGFELQRNELFVRVAGSPLERARAACEILLSGRCDAPLASPGELVALGATLPPGESLVPRERGGKLLFLAVTRTHSHDRRALAREVVLVPHSVELATGRLSDAR